MDGVDLDGIAALIDSSIRVLFNSSKADFTEIFGDDGPYLWDKFTIGFQANEGSFICYLDHKNQKKLAAYVLEYALKNDFRFQRRTL